MSKKGLSPAKDFLVRDVKSSRWCGYQPFSTFPTMFSKPFSVRVAKGCGCVVTSIFFSTRVIFVEPTWGERDILVVATTTVRCMSEFVRTITSTIVDGFQNYLTQLFSVMNRVKNLTQSRRNIVYNYGSTIVGGFKNNLTQLLSIMSRFAI